MDAANVVSLGLSGTGLLVVLAGMASRRRRFPEPAAVLAPVMFLWSLQAVSRLTRSALGPEAAQLGDRLAMAVPSLLMMTILGYIYERALARWRDSQRHLAAVLEAVPSVVAGLDAGGRLVFCNRADGLTALSPDLVASDQVNVAERLGLHPWPPIATRSVERTVRDGAGLARTWLATLRPLSPPLPDGSVGIGCFLDVTELHELRRQAEQLQRLETAGVLAAGVAHELNNQLMAILVHTEALLNHPGHDPTTQEYADVVLKAADRAKRMVTQLTQLAHPSRNLKMAPLDPRQVVEEVVRLVRPVLGPSVTLTTDLAPHLPTLQADPDALHQVLLNLLLNAREAVGERGRITVRVYPTQRILPLRAADLQPNGVPEPLPCLAFEVEDDGPGMTPAVARRVFTPFFSAKASGSGAGLGLPVSYALVAAHGGDIAVDSAPGRGSKFTVFLPLKPRPGCLPSQPQPPALARNILIVDDEQLLLSALAAALAARGFTVATASSGQEALARAADLPRLDALVLDLVLPDTDGLQLADSLSPKHPGARTILITAYPSDYVQAQAARRGIPVLAKPVSPDDLCTALSISHP
jgi:signal transduction histidine kinase